MKAKSAVHHVIVALNVILLGVFLEPPAFAQEQYFGAALIPPKPTSTDYIVYIKAIGTAPCGRAPYKTIKMVNNNITIEFSTYPPVVGAPLPRLPGLLDDTEMVEIGQLPPGDYTITPVNAECPVEKKPAIGTTPFAFTVTDGRTTRFMDGGGIDLSGHWWDADNPGSGLFVWQDAAKNTLVAWFTYTADGKAVWYVFQPKMYDRIVGSTAPLLQTSKPPGNTIPLTGSTQFNTVGEAGYQSYFTPILSGPYLGQPELIVKLFYHFGDGKWQTRVLRRFSAK